MLENNKLVERTTQLSDCVNERRLYYGAAYYPEHWPEERWETDAQLMQAAGFSLVRMGEFAWTKMEPEEGRYDFGWLQRAIELLQRYGIRTVLGTPTAAPPKWLVDRHPDIYPIDFKGHLKGYGHRRYYCYNNHNLRHHVARLVEAMGRTFGRHPAVAGWQIDNELGCVDTVRCFCENCRRDFHTWLRARYADIDDLNEQWGTVFSNQTYRSFDDIILPTYGPIQLHNPGLELDFRRFSSDSVLRFLDLQVESLRRHVDGQLITTNLMQSFTQIDYHRMAKNLDILGFDIYPITAPAYPPDHAMSAFEYDMVRGAGDNKPYWVLEMQSGAPGGDVIRKGPKPGELARWAWQAIAHGADALVFFRWRTCSFGLEEFWHGILDHDGRENRRYQEVRAFGQRLQKLRPLFCGTSLSASVALVYSYDNDWVFEIQPQIRGFKYREQVIRTYAALNHSNIPVEIVSMGADLSRFQLVILPNLIMPHPDFTVKLEAFVRSGGTVLLDFRAGAKLWNNRMDENGLPGAFRRLLGLRVVEYGVLNPDEQLPLTWHKPAMASPSSADGQLECGFGERWFEVLELEGAEVLASYASDYMAGTPAAAVHRFGDGVAYYLGTELSPALYAAFLRALCAELRIDPVLCRPVPGVEVIRRSNSTQDLFVVINHNGITATIELQTPQCCEETGETVSAVLSLQPNEVRILSANRD